MRKPYLTTYSDLERFARTADIGDVLEGDHWLIVSRKELLKIHSRSRPAEDNEEPDTGAIVTRPYLVEGIPVLVPNVAGFVEVIPVWSVASHDGRFTIQATSPGEGGLQDPCTKHDHPSGCSCSGCPPPQNCCFIDTGVGYSCKCSSSACASEIGSVEPCP